MIQSFCNTTSIIVAAKTGLCHGRADVMFDPLGYSGPKVKSLDELPQQKHKELFEKRTYNDFSIDLKKTINENMKKYISNAKLQTKYKVVLCGKLSIIGQFLTRNGIENVIGIIRHPLHNLGAAWVRRNPNHPKKITKSNTLYSEEAIEIYATWWNCLVLDLLNSNNIILRYEYIKEDVKKFNIKSDEKTMKMLNGWKWRKKQPPKLNEELIEYFKGLVQPQYNQLYKQWVI